MGARRLRLILLLAALVCSQTLAFAHGFDHPLDTPHAGFHCLSCPLGGHGGSAPLPPAADLSIAPPPRQTAPVGSIVVDRRDGVRLAYRSRGPPHALV